jgi:HAD superfamily hydrolase (TIGR01509 family)
MAELVIFDCDGVLIDSEVHYCRAGAETFAELGVAMSLPEFMRRYVGIALPDMAASMRHEFGAALAERWLQLAPPRGRAYAAAGLQAVAGVAEVVAGMTTPKCVASSTGPEGLRRSLGQVGLFEHFAPHIFSATMVKRGKPAPDLFVFACEQMGRRSDQCLVIEDSVPGVTAARAAGMRVLGFTGASHRYPELADRLTAAGAEIIFDDMRQLPELAR